MPSPQIAPIAESVPYSRVRAIAEIAMRMDNVYPLYFGESNLPTPDFIKAALDKAVRDGYTYYTSNAGLLSLRETIAGYYADMHQVALDPATEILVTASGVQAQRKCICASPAHLRFPLASMASIPQPKAS